jgi:hypothetical protein
VRTLPLLWIALGLAAAEPSYFREIRVLSASLYEICRS